MWYLKTLEESSVKELSETSEGAARRSRRVQNKEVVSTQLVNYVLMSQIGESMEPCTFEKARRVPRWRAAMEVEMESILRNHTWDLVERPLRRKIIGTKWIYKAKYKSDGSLDKYKVQLVDAKGFSQVEGLDYYETFSPTAMMTMIRTVIALVAHHQWPFFHMDVKSAFLNGDLKRKFM